MPSAPRCAVFIALVVIPLGVTSAFAAECTHPYFDPGCPFIPVAGRIVPTDRDALAPVQVYRSPTPLESGVVAAERRLFERNDPGLASFAFARGPTLGRSSRGTTIVRVIRGQAEVSYRVPRAGRR